jgi:hypothetical protein
MSFFFDLGHVRPVSLTVIFGREPAPAVYVYPQLPSSRLKSSETSLIGNHQRRYIRNFAVIEFQVGRDVTLLVERQRWCIRNFSSSSFKSSEMTEPTPACPLLSSSRFKSSEASHSCESERKAFRNLPSSNSCRHAFSICDACMIYSTSRYIQVQVRIHSTDRVTNENDPLE